MRKIALSGLMILLLTVTGCSMLPTGSASQGVYVGEKNVSGLSPDEIRQLVQSMVDQESHEISVVDSMTGKKTKVAWDKIGIQANIDKTVQQVMAYGYDQDWLEMIKHRWAALQEPVHMEILYEVNGPAAETWLKDYTRTTAHPGTDAELTVSGGQIQHHHAVTGKKVDVAKTFARLKEQVASGSFEQLATIIDENAQPKVTDADLAPIDTILGSYTTHYDPSAVNRSHNIALAADKISGVLLKPGATFSFNDVVGERTAEAGYDDAPVFVDGKLVPGIGGGIC